MITANRRASATTKYDTGRRSWVVSADQLKGAIQKVGNSAQAVEKELKR
jgi:hypothetical protein